MPPSTIRTLLLSLCLWLVLAGCAALPPGKREPRDPWERMNRATFRFNDKFDRAVARPVARGYRAVTPRFVQTGIRNVYDNVDTTIVMLNDLLQGEFKAFASDTGRLLLNTTVGIGGLADPATALGLDKNDRDFGQTLGKWGVGSGPYLVLPFLGPSDVRDGFGRLADTYSTPRTYIKNNYWYWGVWLLEAVDRRSRFLDTDRLMDTAYDPYAFLRSAYLQHRDFKVNGGQSSSEEEQERKLMEEAGEDQQTPESTPPQASPQSPQASPQSPQASPQPAPPPPSSPPRP
jgi:phospholipid-binding lipoprotein MlaA